MAWNGGGGEVVWVKDVGGGGSGWGGRTICAYTFVRHITGYSFA